ncbi:hypothetical protein BDZ97DRAFT_1758452 [Flammula alnicola]|nr:hypothetical protein BDZ97DRAFT_1758452 [Flammula alnicola]
MDQGVPNWGRIHSKGPFDAGDMAHILQPLAVIPSNRNSASSPFPALYSSELLQRGSHFSGSNKENDPQAMTITAPVPLSYAVRSKAALRSILSVGDEDEVAPEEGVNNMNLNQESAEFEITHPERTSNWPQGIRFAMMDAEQIDPGSKQTTQPGMIIRPISPSTLMALTEPCLMAWCSAPDSDLPISTARVSQMTSIQYHPTPDTRRTLYGDTQNMASNPLNSWGY